MTVIINSQSFYTAHTGQMTLTFSDALPPRDLVSWLSQELQAKGLSLDQKLKDKLIGKIITSAHGVCLV